MPSRKDGDKSAEFDLYEDIRSTRLKGRSMNKLEWSKPPSAGDYFSARSMRIRRTRDAPSILINPQHPGNQLTPDDHDHLRQVEEELHIYSGNIIIDITDSPRLAFLDLPLCRGIRGFKDRTFDFISLHTDREEVLEELSGFRVKDLRLCVHDYENIVLKELKIAESLEIDIEQWDTVKELRTSVKLVDCDVSKTKTLKLFGTIPEQLNFLSCFASINELTIAPYSEGSHIRSTVDLSSLVKMPSLRTLIVGGYKIGELDLSPLSELKNLESLALPKVKELDVTPLLKLRGLQSFESYTKKYIADYSFKYNIANLPFRTIDAANKIDYY